MASYEEAPPLPRSPTILRRKNSTPPAPALPPPRDLPLPPRFPSMKDVTTAWTADISDPTESDAHFTNVAWQRPSLAPAPAVPDPPADAPAALDVDAAPSADAAPATPNRGALSAALTKLKAMLPGAANANSGAEEGDSDGAAGVASVSASASASASASTGLRGRGAGEEAAKKPALVKVKEAVCRLPDPTLVFVVEACVMLLLHAARPWWLRTWAARVVAPLLLVPTVAATALWRRTEMVSLRAEPEYTSAAKPIPNAGLVVSLGESLRAREREVIRKEEELRKGQLRLEVLRKEIEGKLPPQVSLASLLESENRAIEENVA